MDKYFICLEGSILDPLVFNIFLCDLSLFSDYNTPYCTGLKISDVLSKLKTAAETLLQWFRYNRMKANPDSYHLLINNKASK